MSARCDAARRRAPFRAVSRPRRGPRAARATGARRAALFRFFARATREATARARDGGTRGDRRADGLKI